MLALLLPRPLCRRREAKGVLDAQDIADAWDIDRAAATIITV